MGRFAATVMFLLIGFMAACVPVGFSDPALAEAQAELDAARRTYAEESARLQSARGILEYQIDEIIARQDGSTLHMAREVRSFLLSSPLPLLIWLPLSIGFFCCCVSCSGWVKPN